MAKQYWLFKSEPSAFSITDLEKAANKTTCWDGVRNYQARNFLKKQVASGDQVFFYHSNAEPAAIVGIAQIAKAGYPDPSAFNPKSHYFDEQSNAKDPTWYSVDIKHVKTFKQAISLAELKSNPKLKGMVLLQKGSRLSIQPVTEKEWKAIVDMAEQN
jgi:predicted RNA-binding protein with PUA-like domain